MENLSDNGETQDRSHDGTGQSRSNPLDVAWLAGIIDGEGTFGTTGTGRKNRYLQPRLAIGNTSIRLMEKVQRIVLEITGLTYRIKPRDMRSKNVVFILEVAKQSAVTSISEAVLPHLTVKREQAEEVLAFCRSRRANLYKGVPLTPEQAGLKDRLKALKRISLVPTEGALETERKALA